LAQRLALAQQVYQRSDPRYIAMYNETMRMLESILAAAPEEAARVEEIQKEIKRLTKEQNDILKDLDDKIEASRKAAEKQIDAINTARDAQIKAAQEAAEQQKQAIYTQAKILYEEFGRIGNAVYAELVKQAERDQDIARQQLDTLRRILLAITGGAEAPPLDPGLGGGGTTIYNPNMYALQKSIMDEIGSAKTLAELEAVSLKWLPLIDQMGEFYRAQGYSQAAIDAAWQEILDFFNTQMARLAQTMMWNMPSYQTGTAFVPHDGPAFLHRGEKVIQAGRSGGEQTIVIRLFENATITGDPATIQRTVKNMIPVIKQELKRTIG
jgi:small-conductance mechanosensitive channel